MVGIYKKSYVCAQRDTGITRVVIGKSRKKSKEEEKNFEPMLKMDHPNVVKCFEIYGDSKHYYIVTELLTGGDLFEHITEVDHFTEHDAAVIMRQVLSAVAYCHSKHIIHRNIKPQNLIFESKKPSSVLKLVDFTSADVIHRKKIHKMALGTIYYTAPEVLQGAYDEKSDVWSCGVLLYFLLAGFLPFIGKTREETIGRIVKGEYTMKGRAWEKVSAEAKDLVRSMLEFRPINRCSAKKAFAHNWIKVYGEKEVDESLTRDVLENLKDFSSKCKLQQAVLTCIVSQLTTKSETEDLRAVFMALDKSGKGQLTREDLIKGYKELYGHKYDEKETVDRIMSHADADKNGSLNYTEFTVATIDKHKVLTRERLEAAFKMFDKDGSGKISAKELKEVLSGNEEIPKDRWEGIVKQVDLNGDSEISLEEFVALMQQLLED
eukprot:TRINITY_DN6675_c0_g2_i7.p1 TRINITY_DN6675_c0_g2~~TRINITY_DN6675_c0_g2_i7.p1  ORF type:complete len:435 (-),score=136.17 TRINITY_DN6675_c0_g2_i7:130-1434(-)